MKKSLLIGTSALASVALFSGAALAAGPELSMSGAIDYAYVVQDGESSVANTDGTDGSSLFAGNSSDQLIFDFAATADNGLEYGGRVDWRWGSNTIDEHYVFFGGSFGKLHVGGDDGVIDNNVPGGESVTAGDFLWDGNNQIVAGGGIGTGGVTSTLASGTDDANKFSYYSPSFGGLSVGLSYVPSNDGGSAYTTSTAGGDDQQVEGTVRFDGSFGGADVAAGVGYAQANASDGSATGNEDTEGLMAGATVNVAGFGVGVGYGDNFDTGTAKNSQADAGGWWNIAASYGFGPATVYGGYAEGEASTGANQEDETEYFGIGVDYTLAEGLKTYAEYGQSEFTDASASTTADMDYFLVGTTVSF